MNQKDTIIYLDNAATSWPKPAQVLDAMNAFYRDAGANPGRSGHRMSVEAGRIVYAAREKLSSLFGAEDPLGVIFTKNATEALNIATQGLLRPGDHVVVSGFEHNALMRPLRYLEKQGISITVLPSTPDYGTDHAAAAAALRPETRLVCCMHASNVTGSIMPIGEIGRICRERGVLFCVDAAQSAGVLSIDMRSMNIDMLAFTGHKGLCGPQGTGGLVLRPGIEKSMRPVILGGTGSRSEREDQPDFLPDMFESGTPNAAGIAGLAEGVEFVLSKGLGPIREHEKKLTALLIEGLLSLPKVKLHGRTDADGRIAVVSFTVEGMSSSDVSYALDERFGIMTRPGCHCAPAAHRSIGSTSEGTVRMSLSLFSTEQEINLAIEALEEIVR